MHALLSLQTLAVPLHVPLWQVSLLVQALPSLQGVPPTTATLIQLPVPVSQVSPVQGLLSSQFLVVPLHTPFWHASPVVQALPSLQELPFATVGYAQLPVSASHPSVVQGLLSLQTLAVPAQVPSLHASPVVHARPSLQPVPSTTLTDLQLPVPTSHASVVHTLLSLQFLALPPHLPRLHTSLTVHGLPSSHGAVMLVRMQVPLLASTESAVHTLPSSQVLLGPLQMPPVQVSGVVVGLPSLQGLPSATLLAPHRPLTGLQLSCVQVLPSSQVLGLPPQLPLVHVSGLVHRSPSLQRVPLATATKLHRPLAALHVSLVQALLSLHTKAVPTQAPDLHASPTVHSLLSSQLTPSLTGLYTQAPLVELQLSAVHAKPSLHTLAVPRQLPLWHMSLLVQALPSVQVLPLPTLANVQLPPTQASFVHALLSLQTLVVPVHLPALQASLRVQGAPSSQLWPSAVAA